MKVLVCHNYYQQPGGEDQVFADECELLRAHGHQVVTFSLHNDDLAGMSRSQMLRKTIWNRSVWQQLTQILQAERPDVAHFHNTFPLISPAALHAASDAGAAVVQTLHNYRLLCPGATLLRDGRICEDCIGQRLKTPAIRHGCYRDNRMATAATAGMLAIHEHWKTWSRTVDRYIALTEFSRQKFMAGGLPAERISVKPNLVQPDPGMGCHSESTAVFVGRLATEKGIDTLLNAWKALPLEIPLQIFGDGPLASDVAAAAAADPRIRWHGRVAFDQVLSAIGRARVLIMPSVWYETFGRTIVEAFATGTPVIASRLGAMQELVDPDRTGLLFEPGDSADLVRQLTTFWQTPQQAVMQQAARNEYEDRFGPAANYRQLLAIYESALGSRTTGRSAQLTTV